MQDCDCETTNEQLPESYGLNTEHRVPHGPPVVPNRASRVQPPREQKSWPYPLRHYNSYNNQQPAGYDVKQLIDIAQKSARGHIHRHTGPSSLSPTADEEELIKIARQNENRQLPIRDKYHQQIKINPYYQWASSDC